MNAELVDALIAMTLATSAAAALAATLRKPLRRIAGAQVAYSLWSLIPVSALAVLLPARRPLAGVTTWSLPDMPVISDVLSAAVRIHPGVGLDYTALFAGVWATGVLAALGILSWRQWMFSRKLGQLVPAQNGLCRCPAATSPMLVGFWRPQIVLPTNFDTYYSSDEQALVLAHEATHRLHKDHVLNALASFALCLVWFHPLMYWVHGRFRFDQELARDAEVLAHLGARSKSYARALFKAQVPNALACLNPLGCHWRPIHPLQERITLLGRALPGLWRQRVGRWISMGLVGVAGYSAWAAQPETMKFASVHPIAVHAVWKIEEISNGATRDTPHETSTMTTNIVVEAGHSFSLFGPSAFDKTHVVTCTFYLPGDKHIADRLARRKIPFDQGIFLACTFTSHGTTLPTMYLVSNDNEPASIEIGEEVPVPSPEHPLSSSKVLYRLEFNASTKPERLRAAGAT